MGEYKNIFELVKYLKDTTPSSSPFLKCEPDDYYWVDARDSLPEELEWVNCGRDFSQAKLFPAVFSGGLYRGQTDVYSPCWPRAYRRFPLVKRPRELSVKHRISFLASQIKTLWFISLLQKHPAVYHARRLKIQMNPIAIAQHYGMTTPYLDLTQSIEVAAFFASCECRDNTWKPRSIGKGVIYRFGQMSNAELIGLVTLPRPGEQKAWVVHLRIGVDFEKLPNVEKFMFNHTRKGSLHYLKMFESGKTLFLEDPAADLAVSIINSRIIPKNFVVQTLLRFGCLPDKLEKTLKIFQSRLAYYCNLEIKNKVSINFSKEQLRKLRVYWSKHKRDYLYTGRVHLVRDMK